MSEEDHQKKLISKQLYYRRLLNKPDGNEFFQSLQNAWEAADSEQGQTAQLLVSDPPTSNPISTLMHCIDQGVYPPPELLLVLHDCYMEYMGEHSDLETAFFGRPRQRSGNFAKRRYKSFLDFRVKMTFSKHLKSGSSRAEAAESTVNEIGLEKDADSLLRELRGFHGFGCNRSEKA